MSDHHGYEYRYKFSLDDTIIHSPYEEEEVMIVDEFKIFQFKIKTNFVIAKIDGSDEIMGSETFDACVPTEFDEHVQAEESSRILYEFVHQRMEEYKMNWQEIEDFADAANNYAKRCYTVDPQYRDLVPIVVHLEVCTVQQEEEPLEATMKRAVRAETLDRVNLSWPRPTGNVDEEALALMEVCPVCLEELTYETHLKRRVCPVCGSVMTVGETSSRWRRRWKNVVRRILSGFR